MPLHPIHDNFIVGNATAGMRSLMSGFVRGKAASGDVTLLAGETDGLAIDWTDTTYFNSPTGSQAWVQERNASVDTLQSPHLFFTQSGTSPKYVKTSATGIGWSPHNLFLNSAVPATQNVTLVIGFNYTVTVTGAGGGDITGSSGASGTATTGTPATFTATGTTGTFTLTGSLDTIQLNRGIASPTHLVTAGAAVIGLPISYGEGLLIEPAATNICVQSQGFATTWANTQTTETANTTTAPDGSTTAYSILETTNNAQHIIAQTVSYVTGNNYTVSCYFKSLGRQYVTIDLAVTRFALTPNVIYDIQNGTIAFANTGAVFSSIENVGDGWYRCVMTATCDSTGTNTTAIYLDNASAYAGDITKGVYAWGFQVELGNVATSYVPTITAGATRATDAVNVAVSSYPHSATLGTMIAWPTYRIANNAAALRVFELGDGTANETIDVEAVTADTPDSFGVSVIDGGAAQVAPGTTKAGSILLAGNKVAVAWQLNTVGIVVGGSAEVTDTGATLPTVTSLQLGYSTATAGRELNGLIRRLIYVPRRMTEAQMQAKTT